MNGVIDGIYVRDVEGTADARAQLPIRPLPANSLSDSADLLIQYEAK